MKTKIICIEGIIGTGKTTQASRIEEFLQIKGKSIILINEKQYAPFKQTVINWHNSGANQTFSYEDILRFAKARAETHQKHFKPLLGELEYILFDRSLYTSSVYQESNNFCSEKIIEINLREGAIKPKEGLVFLCPSEISLWRIDKRRRKRNFYKLPSINETSEEITKRRNLYFQLLSNHPELHLIDASKTEDEVFGDIKRRLEL